MKLTKQDLDKVRHIEGFPIAKDEDIIALSNPPNYTACPNPFIEDFIKQHGKPYDEATDDYHREPFAADVSEGKNDPIYMAHGYHTKVPHKAIMRYILHYTEPGDIIFDGFCGTGMTGVAALSCEKNTTILQDSLFKEDEKVKWGKRNAIISDISPAATFIAYNYTSKLSMSDFEATVLTVIEKVESECNWMYKTNHMVNGKYILHSNSNIVTGNINYTVWSDICICKNCSSEFVYWDVAVDEKEFKEKKVIKCPHCNIELNSRLIDKSYQLYFNDIENNNDKKVKQVPVLIKYTVGKRQFKKKPDNSDLENMEKIVRMNNDHWFPKDYFPEGDKTGEPRRINMDKVYKIYTERSLIILSKLYYNLDRLKDTRFRHFAKFLFSSIYSRSHKMNRYMPNHNRHVGPLAGTLYVPFFQAEINILNLIRDKLEAIKKIGNINNNAYVSTQSATDLINIPINTIDYIFTDPPFGSNIMYSELNFSSESWNKVFTNNRYEAVVNKTQKKDIYDYQDLMVRAFRENFKILKPGRWITIVFHNSQNSVWNSIQESINVAGFVIADVRTLDKQKGTTNQLSYGYAVKQDLVISAYKPKESFMKEFLSHAGSEQTVWDFVRQHLEKLPVVVINNGTIELNTERQPFLLFDRMVAYHIMNGISIPLDASDFYKGLDDKFLKRDGMHFLNDQVNEYATARITTDVESVQMVLFVSDERSAIAWLYQQLNTPQTYAGIQPKFMKEVRSIEKHEKLPELAILLEDNFLQDEQGKWYIPDVNKAADVMKLREKRLIKEFEEYLNSTGKLKLFRTEAIRAGFAKLWKEKNYALVVKTAERLPEKVIQEDDKLLMYYDISLSRI
ncbi:MAG: DNA methylase [Clostridia bacterium]|nr:DNA methylase [Clostridia bacterium]